MKVFCSPFHSLNVQFFHKFLIFLLLGCLLTGCESRRVIVNSLEEKEANEILVFLSNQGIDAKKVRAETEGGGGNKAVLWNVSVENSQANEAMALLNQAGLPRRRGQNLLGIFSNTSLVPSGMQEKIRFQAGLAEQIASTIRKIDGILDADVQISYPDEDPLNPNAPKQKATASVYVKHSGVLDDPNAHLVTRIKRLVAAAVNNLDYDNVTVIGDRARYSDNTLGSQSSLNEENRPYVNVWNIILAKDSLNRFQLYFFSFIIIVILLLSLLSWLAWKFFPFLQTPHALKELFSFQQLSIFKENKEKVEEKTGEQPTEQTGEQKPENQDNKNDIEDSLK